MKTIRTSWLINPAVDFAFFIAAPFLIVPLVHGLLGFLSMTALKLGVLSVSATGHHLPGFIRAYTDSTIFRQFRLRLILVPALLVIASAIAAYFKLSLIFCVLILWSTWHGSMQILGFLRIYDAKAGFLSALTARLDFWLCLSWFVQVVLWSIPRKTSVISAFYISGGPLIPLEWARLFERGWLALTLAVSAAYLVNLAYNAVKHRYFNASKFLCMVFSLGFWAYCISIVPNLVMGLILWEIFHDLQYNVFVWNYNRNRVRQGLSGSRIENFLFRLDWRRLGLYALCIVAYGSVGLLNQDLVHTYENRDTYANILYQIGNVFAASALIHFYMDGFIWKVRDGKVRADLGLKTAGTYRTRNGALHWALVALGFTAAAGMGASEYIHRNSPGWESRDNLAELVPESGYANFMKATRFQAADRPDSALLYYDRAIRHDANYAISHLYIAEIKHNSGDTAGAILHYEKALSADAGDEVVRANLAELYLRTGAFGPAEAEFRRLSERHRENAEYPYKAAWALLQSRKGLQAKPLLERSLALDPDQPLAWNYLGMVEQANGNMNLAGEMYRKALALDSTYVHARENLSALGRPPDAARP